jgi:glycosyltransferase involved in cell wall biosynthesis
VSKDNTDNNKITVLHVAEAAGGVDRYMKALFKYMNRSQISNILVCSQNFSAKDYKPLVDHVEQVHMVHDIKTREDFLTVKNIRKLIKKYRPDVVYGHSSKAGALLRMANLGIRNKVIYNPHGWPFNMRTSEKKRKAYKMIEKVQIPFTDIVVCISEAERQDALKAGICKNSKLQVINNGIDLEEIRTTEALKRQDISIPDDAFVIGTVGRLSEQKAPDVFIEAAHLIKEEIPNAFFVMVGDVIAGPNEFAVKVKKLIKKYGLEDSVLITGWVDNPIAYMKTFDVGMLLSRWEGFGLVIPEYMACGVPVIATRVDAIPYLIEDGVDGVLVDVDQPGQVMKAVLEIREDAESICDKAADKVVEQFDVKRVGKETTELVRRLVR